MADETRFDSGSFVWGLILIGIGVVFLLDSIDLGDAIRSYWPLLIVAVGLAKLFARNSAGEGLTLIAAGLWLQATLLGMFGLTWATSWPLLLIGVGFSMVIQFLIAAARGKREAPHE